VRQCKVLPPGEFNGMITVPLQVYFDGLITTAVTVFSKSCQLANKVTML